MCDTPSYTPLFANLFFTPTMFALFLNVQSLSHFLAHHDLFLFPWPVLYVLISSCLAGTRCWPWVQIYQDHSEKAHLLLIYPHSSFPLSNSSVRMVPKWSDSQTYEPGPSELQNIKLTSTRILSNCNMCLGGITVISYMAGAGANESMKKKNFSLCFSFVVQGLENNLFYSVMWCMLQIWESIRRDL